MKDIEMERKGYIKFKQKWFNLSKETIDYMNKHDKENEWVLVE